jgi:hypothetical protein
LAQSRQRDIAHLILLDQSFDKYNPFMALPSFIHFSSFRITLLTSIIFT